MAILIAILMAQVVHMAQVVEDTALAEAGLVIHRLLKLRQLVEEEVVDDAVVVVEKMEFHFWFVIYPVISPPKTWNMHFDELVMYGMFTYQSIIILVSQRVLHLWNMLLVSKQVKQSMK
jgi:hypothetical protein